MTPEQTGRIFEEFEQAEPTTARAYGGSGLGLAICKKLSRLMNGDIIVHSELARGTTFTITLPTRPRRESPDDDYVGASRQRLDLVAVTGCTLIDGLRVKRGLEAFGRPGSADADRKFGESSFKRRRVSAPAPLIRWCGQYGFGGVLRSFSAVRRRASSLRASSAWRVLISSRS